MLKKYFLFKVFNLKFSLRYFCSIQEVDKFLDQKEKYVLVKDGKQLLSLKLNKSDLEKNQNKYFIL